MVNNAEMSSEAKIVQRKIKNKKSKVAAPASSSEHERVEEPNNTPASLPAPSAPKERAPRKRPTPAVTSESDVATDGAETEPERDNNNNDNNNEAEPKKEPADYSVRDLQDRRDSNSKRRREIRLQINRLLNEIRDLDKSDYQIESLLLREVKKKRKRVISDKTREALAAPMELTPKFCRFLGLPEGTMMPRKDAKNRVHQYVIDQNLRLDADKRFFYLDKKLQDLFGNPPPIELKSEDLAKLKIKNTQNLLGYFYMQKYINQLFIKPNKNETESEESAAVTAARA